MDSNNEGIVYVLKNPAFPNLVKIGITTRDQVSIRMAELYTTGVPLPFKCVFAGKVDDPKKVESALHHAFTNTRVNPSREFFDIDESQAIAILRLLISEEVTPIVSDELEKVDEVSKNASKEYAKSKRPKQNFVEMGIKLGEVISTADGLITCKIAEEKKVEYEGEIMSLTRLTRKLKELDYDIQPGPHWFYKGRSLKEIYDETYETL
jgi:hypothetical protein